MSDITLHAGKHAIYQAQGIGGDNNPYPLAPGFTTITIAPADATKVYVVGVLPDKFQFVPKSPFPIAGSNVSFGFTYSAKDGASGVQLPTLSLTGQIDGPALAPQQATHLALPLVLELDMITNPPPADPGTNSATV